MTLVWISDLQYHKILQTLALNFFTNYWLFEKVYQIFHSVFHLISRLLEVGLKKLGCATFFNPLLGILIPDETQRVVFDILHHGLTQTMLFYALRFTHYEGSTSKWWSNWTSKQIECDLKSQEYDFRPKCTSRNSITTLSQPFWNRRIQSVPIFVSPNSRFV